MSWDTRSIGSTSDEYLSITSDTSSFSTPSSPTSEKTEWFERSDEGRILSTGSADVIDFAVDDADVSTPDKWVRREPSMIRLMGKHPFNSEAPLDKLFAAGFLTPTSLFYVRNHGAVPYVDADRATNWRLRIYGLVEREAEFSIDDLKGMFQVVTLPVTLACAGNRRKEQNVVKKSVGFNWGPAGVSTALFTGVYTRRRTQLRAPLRPTLAKHHVVFEGADTDLPNGPYGTSQTLRDAANVEKGMMIVWGMNGKAILPAQVTTQQARDEKHWWYNRNYLINDLNVNSAIAQPSHDEIVELSKPTRASYDIRGYAYSGGGRGVIRVEISLDHGDSWKISDIVYPEDLYRTVALESKFYGTLDLTERDTSFCWCFWKYTASIEELSKSDVIMVRAMDESLGIQPQDMYWTATGMMNNWWFRVAVHHEVKDGANILRFEHPTLAGVAPGGWMERTKNAGLNPLIPEFGAPKAKEQNNHDAVSHRPQSLERREQVASMTNSEATRVIPMDERLSLTIGEKRKSVFSIVDGNVYDGMGFSEEHPGGADSIRLASGSGEADATEDFVVIHSDDARTKLRKFHIGKLQDNAATEQLLGDDTGVVPDDPSSVFLDRLKWKIASRALVKITSVPHNSFIYRFALELPEQPLGLPVASQQTVFARLQGKTTTGRRWSNERTLPPSHNWANIMVVLIYWSISSYELVVVGDTVELKGPLGSSIVWGGKGNVIYGKVLSLEEDEIWAGASSTGEVESLLFFKSFATFFTTKKISETHLYLLDANKIDKSQAQDTSITKGTTKDNAIRLASRPPPVEWASGPPTDDAMVFVLCGPNGASSTERYY
ncbi:Mo-co oxidoreductase dimerization domain-containing protein [Cantharellus anzutake]|uniref:Mo-co oxidoreductase dimerization domain-containing protein n=1 Tax=Cantharellus anzutake TaxID=1750568 RepID=UPI0019062535|nr:Mo-co oxidoreductase dimerization domain-containing protein [Cantharellus anzutake]KAF8332412.1 Mo-co oxidoreductase dimerization domain-containing protein [Cantharellus anzutake]